MIKSIEIEIGDQTLKLSPEDARRLHGELNEIFGTKEVVWYPNWQWYPNRIRTYPTIYPITTTTETTNGRPFETSGCISVQ